MNPDEAATVPPARPSSGSADEPSDARYVLGAKLGEGAMGGVWAARDVALDRDVAFKVLHDAFLGAEHQDRLAREARAMARLNHPNVVAVYDVGQRHGRTYLTMELVRGSSLSAWLQTPRTLDQILTVFREAAAGLAAAHEAGIVHRDIKPTNILVGDDGRARVADFGVAHAGTARPNAGEHVTTATAGMIGTPAYMAPEQLAGEPSDGRADQFALCVSLFEALRGVRPFDAKTVGGLLMAITRGPPPPTRDLPVWLQDVIARGLAASPDARFPSMTALRAALAGPRPRRALYAAVGLGVVAVAGTVAFLAMRGGGAVDEPVAVRAPDAAPVADAPVSGRAQALRHLSDGIKHYEAQDYSLALEEFQRAIPLEDGSAVAVMWAARVSCDLNDERAARAYLAKIPTDTAEGKKGRSWVVTHCAKNIDLRDTVAVDVPVPTPGSGSAGSGSAPKLGSATVTPLHLEERKRRYADAMKLARAAHLSGDNAGAQRHALAAIAVRAPGDLDAHGMAIPAACRVADRATARRLFAEIPRTTAGLDLRASVAAVCAKHGFDLTDLMDPSEKRPIVAVGSGSAPASREERLARYKELMEQVRTTRKAGELEAARKHALEASVFREFNATEALYMAVIISCQLNDAPAARELFVKIPLLAANGRQTRADAVAYCERQGISLLELMDPSERKTSVP